VVNHELDICMPRFTMCSMMVSHFSIYVCNLRLINLIYVYQELDIYVPCFR